MNKKMVAALALSAAAVAMSGCESSFKGVKLDETGAVSSDPKRQGIPYALTRPKFKVVKDDKYTYSVAVTYVPDATQRYSLRLDPAIFADTSFKMTWGDGGELSGLSAKATDQVAPTAIALINLVTDVTTGLATAAAAAGDNATVEGGCLAKATAADVIVCAMRASDRRAVLVAVEKHLPPPAPICPKAMVDTFEERLKAFKTDDGKDQGDAVGSLYAMNPEQEACFNAAAAELLVASVEAIGAAPKAPAAPADGEVAPKAQLETVKEKTYGPSNVQPLALLALTAFDDTRLRVSASARPQWYGSQTVAKTRAKLIAALTPQTADDLRALSAAAARHPGGDRAAFYSVLGIKDCRDGLAPTAPAPPACEIEDKTSGAIVEAVSAAGLNTAPVGQRLDQIGRATPLAKGLRLAAALPTPEWRKRRIVGLDREEAAAIKAALMRAPNANPDADQAVLAARQQKAAVVGLLPEFERLSLIRTRLDRLPSTVLSTRQSPGTEYAALRTEGEHLETLIAARLSAATPPASSKTATETLPPDAPWVSEACVTASKKKLGWSYLEGKDAPDYVIVLRRPNGSLAPINPKSNECGQ